MLELCENVCLISTEHSPQLMRKTKQAKSRSEEKSKISCYFRFLLQFAKVSALQPTNITAQGTPMPRFTDSLEKNLTLSPPISLVDKRSQQQLGENGKDLDEEYVRIMSLQTIHQLFSTCPFSWEVGGL